MMTPDTRSDPGASPDENDPDSIVLLSETVSYYDVLLAVIKPELKSLTV